MMDLQWYEWWRIFNIVSGTAMMLVVCFVGPLRWKKYTTKMKVAWLSIVLWLLSAVDNAIEALLRGDFLHPLTVITTICILLTAAFIFLPGDFIKEDKAPSPHIPPTR